MHVDVIREPDSLLRLRKNWDELYGRDSEAQYFLSWPFISTYLRRFDGSWLILAVRRGPPGSGYVAFLPLRLRTRMNRKEGFFYNELIMGGNYAADYTGILCPDEFADRAIATLGKHMRRMHWTRVHFENLRMSNPRLRCLLANVADDRLKARWVSHVNKFDHIDNSRCPAVDLPETFELYLQEKVGKSTRQKMRRFLRKVEESGEYRITVADRLTVQRDIEVILKLWRIKWTPRKGTRVDAIERNNRQLLRRAWEQGSLFLPVLWHGDRPLGALANFLDPVKQTMLFHMAGRDESSDLVPSGIVLHGYSIRHAISLGFHKYDMMRGNEPYKYSFGTRDTKIRSILVESRTGRNLGDRLDPACLGPVFREAREIHQKGELVRAEAAYRQILATEDEHTDALYGLGQILSTKGDHRGSAEIFRTLSRISPKASKVWHRLGTELSALDRPSEAVAAFRKAVELNSAHVAARYGLGLSLMELHQLADAAGVFTTILQSRSQDPADAAFRSKARMQLSRLKQRQNPLVVVPQKAKNGELPRLPDPKAVPVPALHTSVSTLLLGAR